jgi:hypothetical protein
MLRIQKLYQIFNINEKPNCLIRSVQERLRHVEMR